MGRKPGVPVSKTENKGSESLDAAIASATTTASGDAPRKRQRKMKKFVLAKIETTEPLRNDKGEVLPDSVQEVFVPMPMPPGIDESQLRSREAIRRACHKAVYSGGLEQYGNVKLVVLSYDEAFEVKYAKKTVTQLLPASD